MVGYKLSKNDLVAPFFVIFRSVREKLLVTVFFDHPVARVLTHVLVLLNGASQLYPHFASTCSNTRASTCSNTRATI